MKRLPTGAAIIASLFATSHPLQAQDVSRQSLLQFPDPMRAAMADKGIGIGLTYTQFFQGVTRGEGSKSWQFGNKTDFTFSLDGAKMGLWDGFSIRGHGEFLGGSDATSLGSGVLLPTNTALGAPRLSQSDTYLSVVFSQ